VAVLNEEQIADRLTDLRGWRVEDGALRKTFDRGNFIGSVEFVRRLVEPAEVLNHHPDLRVSWNEVEVIITTHSEGGLTAADFELAARIDELV
jgi:4a-hydroxytetrahydrobiopterin dehydratase